MRRLVVLFVVLCLICIAPYQTPFVFASDAPGEAEDQATFYLPTAKEVSGDLTIRAKSYILIDAATGTVLTANNEHAAVYPASVTKIMSLLLAAEAVDSGQIKLSDEVTTSTNAASKGGSQIWLREGETMTVDDLLKATAVSSANDACTALSEYISGSAEAFVMRMNERAKELKMTDTHFENCTGLDDNTENHITSAYDVALMSRALLQHEMILNYTTIWMDTLRGGETELVNTNKLVRFYEGATGLKTGTTAKAGCCVSASAMRDNTHLIAVVMGSDNSKDRFEGAKALLNWGFANYATVTPEIDRSLIAPVRVIKGVQESIVPEIPQVDPVLVPKGKGDSIKQEMEMSLDVEAPVEKGQTLGTVTFLLDGKPIGSYALTSPETVAPLSVRILYSRLLGTLAE